METCIALDTEGWDGEEEKVATGEEERLMGRGDERRERLVAAWLAAAGQRFESKSQSGFAWLPCLLIAPLWLQRLGPAGHQGTTLEMWVTVGRRE